MRWEETAGDVTNAHVRSTNRVLIVRATWLPALFGCGHVLVKELCAGRRALLCVDDHGSRSVLCVDSHVLVHKHRGPDGVLCRVAGAQIKVSQKGEYAPGTTNRIVTISGNPQSAQIAHT